MIPYAHDLDLTLLYNNDIFSGIADTYLQGSLKTTHTFNSTTRFEIVEQPKLGTLGWNNSLAGKFIYSPIYVTRLTRTDNFTYRAVNDYGESNWAVVNIEFDHDNESDGVLKTIVGIAILSVGASLGGLVRVLFLQLILDPAKKFNGQPWTFLGGFVMPAEDAFVLGKSAADYKVAMHESDEEDEGLDTETVDNPLPSNAAEFVDDTDEFT